MYIVLIGTETHRTVLAPRFAECKHELVWVHDRDVATTRFENANAILDFELDVHPEHLRRYATLVGKPVIAASVTYALGEMAARFCPNPVRCKLGGLNAFPGFLERPAWEMSALHDDDRSDLTGVAEILGVKPLWVTDRVGMVSPRIMAMIINEAYRTQEAGTATAEDINTAMRLGVNYPGGPFEWVERWGVARTYKLLQRLTEATGEPRYRPAASLQRAAWREMYDRA